MPRFAFINVWAVFLVCFFSKAYAQSTIHVESFENQAALAYASIVNHTKHSLLFTDEQGNASVNFTNGDSLSISYVGYHTLKIIFTITQKQNYALKQKQNLLEPVKIENCKSWIHTDYSNLNADTSKRKFGGVGWDKGAMDAKVAVMLKPPVKQGKLKSFSIWLKKNIPAPKISVQAPLKLSFYNINDSSGLPGELISNRQVIYHPKKEGKQIISLDSIRVTIPENGIYVCIEYVMNEKYEWPIGQVDQDKGIGSTQIRYGANLDGIFSKDFGLAFYNYEKNNWSFPVGQDKSILTRSHGTIKCSAEIIYCQDKRSY